MLRACGTLAAIVALAWAPAAAAEPLVLAAPDGSYVRLIDDPALPAPEPVPPGITTGAPAPAQARAAGPSVLGAIAALRRRRAIDADLAEQYQDDWKRSVRIAKRLPRARAAELRAVLATTRDLAARNLLSATRLPAVMLTVVRNRSWWAGGATVAPGRRVRFKDSQLIWQYYPGQGLQIQWLGTFGRANALWSFTGKDDELAQLLAEARALAASRAGGIAYEYLFVFGGGRPPWVSGLAQGTALTAFMRGSARLKEPSYADDAKAALGIFRTAPPKGVRLALPGGVHYLQYSFARDQRIANGFVQALNGLRDYAALGNSDEGWRLFRAGERELRTELRRYDTGAWSLYEWRRGRPGAESTLDYHKLLAQFLGGLCERLTGDRERAGAKAAQATGGASPADAATPAPAERSALAGQTDPAPYCKAEARMRGYLTTKPVVTITARSLRTGRRGTVRVRLSKIASTTVRLRQGGRVLLARSATLSRGCTRSRSGHAAARSGRR